MVFKTSSDSSRFYQLLLTLVLFQAIESARNRCQLPAGNACTDLTPIQTKAEGLGVYYQNPCQGVGCGFVQPYCRLCWVDPKAPARLDRPRCPPCVADHFRRANTTESFCHLPRGKSCTSMTPHNVKLEGLGVYYENPCHGVGCGFFQPYCRLCWVDPKAAGRMDRRQCPPCVSIILHKQ